MATTTSVRPSIGRIINSVGHQHAANPSPFLAALSSRAAQSCPFSSTPERSNRRPRRDNNRLRGLSSIYRSGPRFRMNIDKNEVPIPADYKPKVDVDPNHGLWDFFYSKEKFLLTPEEDAEHGRGWTVEELRHKSWEDLHKLWWVCIKEQNRIATARKEKARLKLRDGAEEIAERLAEVRKTMKAIKHALTERFYLWEDARKLAETDPEVDLGNTNHPYTPGSYLEEEDVQSAEAGEGQQEGSEKSAAETVDPSTLPPSATETQQPSARV
ncbi:MRP-L47-domain-containing protein [Hypomontagnella monticulosa]|nr:MRP-L47-domain-containing protein [Hypomontagnella monticulosa]